MIWFGLLLVILLFSAGWVLRLQILKLRLRIQKLESEQSAHQGIRYLCDSMDIVAWTFDLGAFEFKFCGQAVDSLTGYSVHELDKSVLCSLLSTEKQQQWSEQWKKLLEQEARLPGSFHKVSAELTRKDGSLCLSETHCFFTYDCVAGSRLLSGITLDTSSLQNMEAKLHTLSQAIQQSPVSVVITDGEGTILYCNQKCCEVSGYTFEEILGQNPRVLKGGNQPPGFYERMWADLTAGHTWKGVFENKRKDGSFYFESAMIGPVLDEKGHTTHYLAIKEDISETLRMQKELKLQEGRFRLIFEEAQVGIAQYDLNGVIQSCNSTFSHVFGVTKDELVGLELGRLAGGEIAEAVKCSLAGERQFYEGECLSLLSGKSVFVRMLLNLIKTEDHLALGGIAIVDDITVEVEAKERLLEMNRTKDKLFSIIGHDLRTPFSGIIGLSGLAKDELERNEFESLRESLVMIESSALGAHKLLENLLEWARVQRGKINYAPHSLFLSIIVKDVLELLEQSARNKQITIVSEIPKTTKVFADPDMLSTILRNLVSNAIKFTFPGGRIVLSANCTDESRVRICVSDNGIGMEQSVAERLFEVGAVKSRPGTEAETGTGLGLILCKDFVNLHRGKIYATSQKGKGSDFFVELNETQED